MRFKFKNLIPSNVTRYTKKDRGVTPRQRKSKNSGSGSGYKMPRTPKKSGYGWK